MKRRLVPADGGAQVEVFTKPPKKPRQRREISLDESATYRQQFIDCRKPKCKACKRGPSHGPYWYAEVKTSRGRAWYEKRRVRTQYIGRNLPPEIAEWVAQVGEAEARAAAQEQLAREAAAAAQLAHDLARDAAAGDD